MTSFERNHIAKQYRAIRKILRGNEPYQSPPALQEDEKTMFSASMLFISILIAGLMFIVSCIHSTPAHAEIPQDKAIRILVGEASNQGFKGMVCVAEVLRRTGSTRGFYGLHASHSAHEPKWVWEMARKAWMASASTNYTHGADHFENLKFGIPYWCRNCVITAKIGDHTFFRETL